MGLLTILFEIKGLGALSNPGIRYYIYPIVPVYPHYWTLSLTKGENANSLVLNKGGKRKLPCLEASLTLAPPVRLKLMDSFVVCKNVVPDKGVSGIPPSFWLAAGQQGTGICMAVLSWQRMASQGNQKCMSHVPLGRQRTRLFHSSSSSARFPNLGFLLFTVLRAWRFDHVPGLMSWGKEGILLLALWWQLLLQALSNNEMHVNFIPPTHASAD